jgi:hypothetical protein
VPKPKPKKAPPPVAVDPRSLTPEQLGAAERRRDANDRKLLRHLGLHEPQNLQEMEVQYRIVRESDILVSGFKPLRTDGPANNAYWREGLLPVLADADKLRSTLSASAVRDYLDALCEQSELSLRDMEQTLTKLCDTLRQEVARLRESDSLGRPCSNTLRDLVLSLGAFFKQEYRGNATKERVRRGPVVKLSPYERARNAFVEHVLCSHGIYRDDIQRYFRPRPRKKK